MTSIGGQWAGAAVQRKATLLKFLGCQHLSLKLITDNLSEVWDTWGKTPPTIQTFFRHYWHCSRFNMFSLETADRSNFTCKLVLLMDGGPLGSSGFLGWYWSSDTSLKTWFTTSTVSRIRFGAYISSLTFKIYPQKSWLRSLKRGLNQSLRLGRLTWTMKSSEEKICLYVFIYCGKFRNRKEC